MEVYIGVLAVCILLTVVLILIGGPTTDEERRKAADRRMREYSAQQAARIHDLRAEARARMYALQNLPPRSFVMLHPPRHVPLPPAKRKESR